MFNENRPLEFLILAAVALIVVGPKDLPILLRRIGKVIGKMRAMANEFRASFDEMARQSELDELRREVEALRTSRTAEPHPVFDEINQHLSADSGVSFSPANAAQAAADGADQVPVEPVAETPHEDPEPEPKAVAGSA